MRFMWDIAEHVMKFMKCRLILNNDATFIINLTYTIYVYSIYAFKSNQKQSHTHTLTPRLTHATQHNKTNLTLVSSPSS